MSTKYQKFGLRADRNLTDLENKPLALANMLDGLQVDDDGFDPADLLVINGLRNTEVDVSDLQQVADDTNLITYTPIDQPGVNFPVRPLVRIIDRIENYKVITGTPNFANGGDGPNAWFIPSSSITPYASLSQASAGDDVVNRNGADVIGPVDFWDNGTFRFGLKVNDEFPDSYGGVQWEGYTSLTRFTIETTGTYMIEYDPYDTGVWEIVKSIYAEDRTVSYVSSTDDGTNTSITLAEGQLKYVSIGDFVIENGQRVLVNEISGNTLTFQGLVSGLSPTGGNITLSFEMSDEPVQSEPIALRTSYVGDKFKIRITCWWNDRGDGDRLPTKDFEFYDVDSERYPFSYFYKEYTRGVEPVLHTYEHFAKYKASPTAKLSTAALETSETIAVKYKAPLNVSEKIKATRTYTFDGLGKLIGDVSGVEVGDWIVVEKTAGIFGCWQVLYMGSGEMWVDYDQFENWSDYLVGTTFSATIVSHLGLIGIYEGTGSGNTLNLIEIAGGKSKNEVRSDYLVARSNNTKFQRILSVSNGTVTTSDFASTGETFNASELFTVVYASTGLQDLSSEVQCQGIFGKEAIADSGTNTITVSDTNGISVGDYVQFLTGSTATDRLDENTRVSSINGNVITLNKNVIGTIPAGATIVFVPTSVYVGENREYCVLPLNTAPPFRGTDEGLATTASFPNIKFKGLRFTDISLNNTTTADNGGQYSYSEYIDITHNGVSYKMLVK